MPTDQPSNAPDGIPPKPRDDVTAAAVMHDEQLDDAPGGGGLGGAAAADPLSGTAGPKLGATRNSPIDSGIDADSDAKAEAEARQRAVNSGPAEPHPTSL